MGEDVGGEGTSDKREAFKHKIARVHSQHAAIKVKGEADRKRESWKTRDIEALVQKNCGIMSKQLGSTVK